MYSQVCSFMIVLTLVECISDYQKYFQPFRVRQGVVLAPVPHSNLDQTQLEFHRVGIDSILTQQDSTLTTPRTFPSRLSNLVHARLPTLMPTHPKLSYKPRGYTLPHTAKDVSDPPTTYTLTLRRKHVQFTEDVRPAYNGTITRPNTLTPRNPFKRDPLTLSYDYDSEAEWEPEPEDAENLDLESSDDDDDEGDVADEEDAAFLDDAEEGARGRRFAAPLVPFVKGICWESVEGGQQEEMLRGMRAEVLLFDEAGEPRTGTIDPSRGEYWVSEMAPPVKGDGQMLLKVDNAGVDVVKGAGKTKTPFPDALLRDFLRAIDGTTHNQILLVELLKKKYLPRRCA
jgi:chromatin assembly factor 1 subunit A